MYKAAQFASEAVKHQRSEAARKANATRKARKAEADKVKTGDTVVYVCENGSLLGPFTVSVGEDGSVHLYYKRSEAPKDEGDRGDHVHSITDNQAILFGLPYEEINKMRVKKCHPILAEILEAHNVKAPQEFLSKAQQAPSEMVN